MQSRRKANFHADDAAVSEVIGQILSLGIMSALLITSLLGFSVAKDNAIEQAVAVRGDALLQKVSTTAIQAALFAEDNAGSGFTLNATIDLPFDIEGHQYMVDLDADEVFFIFPTFQVTVSAPLFQAGAGSGISFCDQDPLPGGPLLLRVLPDDHVDVPTGASCDGDGTKFSLFLEIGS